MDIFLWQFRFLNLFLTLFRLTPKDVSEQQVFELLLLNTFDVS